MPLLSNSGSSTSTFFICVHCTSADDVYLELYRLVPVNFNTVVWIMSMRRCHLQLYCIALQCFVLYCIVFYSIVLYCSTLYCSTLYCIIKVTPLAQRAGTYVWWTWHKVKQQKNRSRHTQLHGIIAHVWYIQLKSWRCIGVVQIYVCFTMFVVWTFIKFLTDNVRSYNGRHTSDMVKCSDN